MKKYDAVVIGSGPNGLSAAIKLAQANLSVLLIEAKSTIGGGMRSAEVTLPGFHHDLCASILPLGIGSPLFKSLPLTSYGLKWIEPISPLAHPFKEGECVILDKSIETTCNYLGQDAVAYKNLMEPFVSSWNELAVDILGPLQFPSHPLLFARFGLQAIRSAEGLGNSKFHTRETRALFAGLAAHSTLPLNKLLTAGYALVLGILAHSVGWPVVQGGTQNLANALASYFRSLGGEILTDAKVNHLDEIPPAKALIFDVTPKQLIDIAGDQFPSMYRNRLKKYRYGPGVFKIDWALSQPIPWKNKECLKGGTVHLGGTLEEIAASEQQVWDGKIPQNNFMILSQPTLFDPSRAPKGAHTAWGYCHVPNGSKVDMTNQIESQIEQYAPGFKDCILARKSSSPSDLENYNGNLVGGDINGGAGDIFQFFARPAYRIVPYSTPIKGVYICSSSTPPGGGVHGMCGYYAAVAAISHLK